MWHAKEPLLVMAKSIGQDLQPFTGNGNVQAKNAQLNDWLDGVLRRIGNISAM